LPYQSGTKELRVGLIGFGRIAAVHLQAWRECQGVRLLAACDVDTGARRRAAEQGLAVFDSAEEMLEAVRPDVLSICTPPSSHQELANCCLERGLHVLCEKPLTVDFSSALELAGTVARKRGTLLVASKFRHVPELARARELVRGGDLGRVSGFRIEFAAPVAMADRWNAVPAVSGGGVIIDNGWHAFDLVHFLFGGIDSVATQMGDGGQVLAVEDSATITVTTAAGEKGEIVLSWSAPSSGDDYVTIRGARGSVHVGWKSSCLRRGDGATVPLGTGYDRTEAHRRMMACFRDVGAGSGEPWISMDETMGIAASVEAAYRSSRSLVTEAVRLNMPMEAPV
jgi:predicted dehydrogenase